MKQRIKGLLALMIVAAMLIPMMCMSVFAIEYVSIGSLNHGDEINLDADVQIGHSDNYNCIHLTLDGNNVSPEDFTVGSREGGYIINSTKGYYTLYVATKAGNYKLDSITFIGSAGPEYKNLNFYDVAIVKSHSISFEAENAEFENIDFYFFDEITKFPAVPEKDGFIGKWCDESGKEVTVASITEHKDYALHAVYSEYIPPVTTKPAVIDLSKPANISDNTQNAMNSDIIKLIMDRAKSGCSYNITLSANNSVISKSVFKSMTGRNVTLIVNDTYSVNGNDIDKPQTVNFASEKGMPAWVKKIS